MARKRIGNRKKPTGARPTGVSMAARPWSVLLQFSRRSTIHGLNHMAQARSSRRRGYWLLISLGASTGFFMNLYYLIEKFVQKPVLTNVLHDYEAFEFPDITFCVLNPIYFPPENTTRRTELEKYLLKYKQYKENVKKPFAKLFLADYLFVMEKDMYSHPPWSAIAECKFMSNTCNYTHFDVVRLWPYGNCFTLNYTKLGVPARIVLSKDVRSSLRPDFRIKVYKAVNYPKYFVVDPHHSHWMASGILVMLHERGTFPDIGNSFLVDSYTQIELRITRLQHLPINNKCLPYRQNYTYVDRVMKTVRTYIGTRTDCLYKRMQSGLAKYCKCIHYKASPEVHNSHLPLCLPMTFSRSYMGRCMYRLRRSRRNINEKFECFKDFCEHPQFQTVISQAGYPAVVERNSFARWMLQLEQLEKRETQKLGRSNIAKIFLKEHGVTHNLTMVEAINESRYDLLNIERVERNFMVLRIVPSSLFEDRVEEIAEYPISRLLSDIGGCVGLWIGASLITLFEFIDLVLDCTDYRLGYGRRKRLNNFINGGKLNSKTNHDAKITANHIANNNSLNFNSFDFGNSLLENSTFGAALFKDDSEPNTPDFVTTV